MKRRPTARDAKKVRNPRPQPVRKDVDEEPKRRTADDYDEVIEKLIDEAVKAGGNIYPAAVPGITPTTPMSGVWTTTVQTSGTNVSPQVIKDAMQKVREQRVSGMSFANIHATSTTAQQGGTNVVIGPVF